MKRHPCLKRLDATHDRLQERWSLLNSKLEALEKAIILETDPAKKFSLEHQIVDTKKGLGQCENDLNTIEFQTNSQPPIFMYVLGYINAYFQLMIEYWEAEKQIFLQNVSYRLLAYPSGGKGQDDPKEEMDPKYLDTFTDISEVAKYKNCYALMVYGNSLKDIGIRDGDYIIVENIFKEPSSGDLIVARYKGALYVKRFIRENGQIFLRSENPDPEFEDITVEEPDKNLEVLGEVIQAIHNFKRR